MLRRLLTAAVLSALLLGTLNARNPWLFGGLLGLLLAAGAWEWPGLARLPHPAMRVAYALVVITAALWARLNYWASADFATLLGATLLFWVLMLLWLLLAPQWGHRALLLLVAGVGVLVPAWLSLVRVAGDWPHGVRWTLLILAVPVAMDTGGYFTGRAFGRHKLAPQVSPGKTWEGVLGGMLLVALLACLTAGWSGAAPLYYVTLCLGAAAFSVVGDLTESMFKRAAGLKDSGGLFPGHGGALDRIDSIAAAAPIMTLGLIWLGVGT